MRKLSEQTTIWAVLGTGLVLRMLLAFWIYPGNGFRGDMRDFAGWADAMATHGPSAFYANAPSANYPPVYPLVLWPVGVLTPLVADVVGRDAMEVGLVLSKVPAVVADLGIALLLLTAGRRWWGPKVGIGAAALFLVAPVTWYDSAVWGQVDSVAALPVLGSLVLLIDRRPAWAMTCATAAILVKPQSAVVLGCPPPGAGPPPPRRRSGLSDLVQVCRGHDRGPTRCLCALRPRALQPQSVGGCPGRW